MILVDANLLIYSVNRDTPEYEAAHVWLEEAISGTETVGLAWIVILSFLRVTTMPRLFRRPLDVEDAVRVLGNWLEQPTVALIHPGQHHMRILRELILHVGTGGNLTTDSHLAALAIENNAVLYSVDRDFARFPGLHWRNPLRNKR